MFVLDESSTPLQMNTQVFYPLGFGVWMWSWADRLESYFSEATDSSCLGHFEKWKDLGQFLGRHTLEPNPASLTFWENTANLAGSIYHRGIEMTPQKII